MHLASGSPPPFPHKIVGDDARIKGYSSKKWIPNAINPNPQILNPKPSTESHTENVSRRAATNSHHEARDADVCLMEQGLVMRTIRGVRRGKMGRGVGGLNTYNKDVIGL